jgi:hypothetical protein
MKRKPTEAELAANAAAAKLHRSRAALGIKLLRFVEVNEERFLAASIREKLIDGPQDFSDDVALNGAAELMIGKFIQESEARKEAEAGASSMTPASSEPDLGAG